MNGLLFERGDADDLAVQLRRFVEEKHLLGRLMDGTPIVRSTEDEAAELEAIYQDLIRKKAQSGLDAYTTQNVTI